MERVSQIKLSEKRDGKIEFCFSIEIKFHYPQTVDKLVRLIEDFKRLSNSKLKTDKYEQQNDSAEEKPDDENFDEGSCF